MTSVNKVGSNFYILCGTTRPDSDSSLYQPLILLLYTCDKSPSIFRAQITTIDYNSSVLNVVYPS